VNFTKLGTLALGAWLYSAVAFAQTLPADIAASKTVKVALNSPYVPLEMKDPKTNELTGFDIDLGKAMGDILGVKLEYQDGAFEAMTPALQTGRVDMIMSGFYDRPKRRDLFDFVDYLKAGTQFFTLSVSKDINELGDLCGKTVSTIRGTSYPDLIAQVSKDECEAKGKTAITTSTDNGVPQMLINLRTGRSNAAVQGLESVPAIMDAEPGTYRTLGEPLESVYMGMAFDKKNPQLRDAFASALKTVIANGTYDKLVAKWKLGLSALHEPTMNGEAQK
jgi:polar amino acid transport system substrate-binding protein